MLLDVVYPPSCLLCSKELSSSKHSLLCCDCQPPRKTQYIFQETSTDSTYTTCDSCGEWAAKFSPEAEVCIPCALWKPPTRRVRSLWPYKEQLETAIKTLKYKGQLTLAKYLAEFLAEALIDRRPFPETDWDLVVAVPSSTSATRKRGYSPVSLLAKKFAKRCELNYSSLALRSRGPRKAQARMSPEARLRNIANAFLAKPSLVENKNILLIDDVITTGASIWEAARVLQEAGARSVDAYTLTRSAQFGKNRLLWTWN